MFMNLTSWLATWAPLVARIVMGGMFLMSGLQKATDLGGTANYIGLMVDLPYPMVFAMLAMLAEVVFGLMLIVGFQMRLAAAGLSVFVVITTVLFHTNWTDGSQQILFTKNLAIAAGLLYMMTFGSGSYAMDARNKKY